MADTKLALVTGAAGGMGRATVARLVQDGFHVAAIDINGPGLEEVAQSGGARVQTFVCDQTNELHVRETVGKVQSALGSADVLVNLTGWAGTTRFEEEDFAYWRKVIAINFESLLYVVHPVLADMIARKSGKMVFVSSDAARIGTSNEAVYAGSKAAIIAFAKSLARENARHNINVNVVAPGPTETPLLQQETKENAELISRMTRLIPFRRLGQPQDMANAIAFFCSSDSDYITGQVLSVSGGLTMV